MEEPESTIMNLVDVEIEAPEPARIFKSVTCEFCREPVMETRTKEKDGKVACIPCADALERH